MESPTMDLQGNDNMILNAAQKSVHGYSSRDEYLIAMKEDLAEWFNALYHQEQLYISVDTFFESLETGVLLCQHANNVQTKAEEWLTKNGSVAPPSNGFTSPNKNLPTVPPGAKPVQYNNNARPLSFQARDNLCNFISWCRLLGVRDVLLFESDDLVMRKNERSVVLCLLEIARVGSRYGMLAPQLVVLEQEIDRQMAAEAQGEPPPEPEPFVQRQTCDLMSLDEMVRETLSRCTCPSQFPMIRVSEGKYQIGDSQQLIFVRILRNHVMVRIGGGWDTLEHFLDRHDPCRCSNKVHVPRTVRKAPRKGILKGHRTPKRTEVRKRASSVTPPGSLTAMEVRTRTVTYDTPPSDTSQQSTPQSLPRSGGSTSSLQKSGTLPRQGSFGDREGPAQRVRPQSARTSSDGRRTPTQSGVPRSTGSSSNLSFQRSSNVSKSFDATDGYQASSSTPSTPTVRRKLSYQTPASGRRTPDPFSRSERQTPEADDRRGRSTQRSNAEGSKPVQRSRSVGPATRKQNLSVAQPNTFHSKKDEVLLISRDDSGHHRIGGKEATKPSRTLPQRPASAQTRRDAPLERSSTVDYTGMRSRSDIALDEPDDKGTHKMNSTVTADQVYKEVNGQGRRRRNSTSSAGGTLNLSINFDDYPEAPPADQILHDEMVKMFEEYRKWELGLKKKDEEESAKIEKLEKTKLNRQNSGSSSSSETPGIINGKSHVPKIMNPRDRRANSHDSESSCQGLSIKHTGENNKPVLNGHERQVSSSSLSSLDSRSSGESESAVQKKQAIPSYMNGSGVARPSSPSLRKKPVARPSSPALGKKPVIRSSSKSDSGQPPPSPSPMRKLNIGNVLPNTLATTKLVRRQESLQDDDMSARRQGSLQEQDNYSSSVEHKTLNVSNNTTDVSASDISCKSNNLDDSIDHSEMDVELKCNGKVQTEPAKSETDFGKFEVVHYHSPGSSPDEPSSEVMPVADGKPPQARGQVRPASAHPRLPTSRTESTRTKTPTRPGSARALPKTPTERAVTKSRPLTPELSRRRPTTPTPSRRTRPSTPTLCGASTRPRTPSVEPQSRARTSSVDLNRGRSPSVEPQQQRRAEQEQVRSKTPNPATRRPSSAQARSTNPRPAMQNKSGSSSNMLDDTSAPKPSRQIRRCNSTTLLFPEMSNKTCPEFTVYTEPKNRRPDNLEQESICPKFRKDDREGKRTKIPMPVDAMRRQRELDAGAPLRRVDSGVDITSMSPTETIQSEGDAAWHDTRQGEAHVYQGHALATHAWDDDDDDSQYF